ncbi:MAG: PEP-CTERM sorting domain-containing protein [Planctomycetes bacterium]|nr:PEP-CTERM sorting domain-containing protein [Planctomycetota bacterium]
MKTQLMLLASGPVLRFYLTPVGLTLLAFSFLSWTAVDATATVTVLPGSSFTFDGIDGPLVPDGVVPPNLSTEPGATGFAIDTHPAAAHEIFHLNNGVYGNANSWLGVATRPINVDFDGVATVDVPFAGIDFAGADLHSISSFAFGRSNLGDEFADRTAGTYYVQTTTTPDPDVNTPDGDWTTIGGINISSSNFGDTYRHLYTLDAPLSATGLRVVTPGSGTAIDEIEIVGGPVPEPSTLVLAAIGSLSFLLRRRRRRA